jgi:hypothetical protein
MDGNGDCMKPDYINCGDKSSKSRGACIPAKFGKCPLTDVAQSAVQNYTAKALTGFTLYTSNADSNNPVAEAYIRQDHLCFVRSQFPMTVGRERYPLSLGDYTSCKEDGTAWSVGETGEKSFFDANGITSYYSGLPEYNSSDVYRMKLLLARGLEWSPDCADAVPSMLDKRSELEDLFNSYSVMVVIFGISFGVGTSCIIGQFVATLRSAIRLLKWLFLVRSLAFVLALPPVVLAFAKEQRFSDYFERLVEFNCSSDEANVAFMEYNDSIKNETGYKSVDMLAIFLAGYCIETIFFLLYVNFGTDKKEAMCGSCCGCCVKRYKKANQNKVEPSFVIQTELDSTQNPQARDSCHSNSGDTAHSSDEKDLKPAMEAADLHGAELKG